MADVLNPLREDIPSKLLDDKGFKTIYQMFQNSLKGDPDKNCTLYKIKKGHWGSFTYKEIDKGIFDTASALLALGMKKGDRVAIATNNRYEWIMLDLGIHRLGCINVSNYVTPDPEKLVGGEVSFNINNSRSRLLFVEGKYAKKIISMKDKGEIPTIEKIIVLDDDKKFKGRSDILTFTDFLKLGKSNHKLLDDYKEEVGLNDVATIIYTSGSTGVPKGVMLTHGNMLANVENIINMVDLRHSDTELSFLPLAHVFERIIGYLIIRVGGTIGYAESIETIADDALFVKPTVFPAVPRVFEKFKAKVEGNARSKGGLSLKIFNWSIKVGREYSDGKDDIFTTIKYKIANKLVFQKVVNKLGGHIRFFVSSSAPLSHDTGMFFKSMNFEILEAYGMTEAGPLITVNKNGRSRLGTVGEIPPEVYLKIADDDEILIKGPSIMKGFWERPDADKEAFQNGWLATGDMGKLSDDGYLTITDRKKNLLKTSNGKYVPPAPIEDKLISNEYIIQAMVIGDNRPHCSAIIIPDFKRLEDYAQKNNLHYSNYDDLVKEESVIDFYRSIVREATVEFAHHEQPKKVILGPKEWTWESGELTPTQKVKRSVIKSLFKKDIEKLYS